MRFAVVLKDSLSISVKRPISRVWLQAYSAERTERTKGSGHVDTKEKGIRVASEDVLAPVQFAEC